MANQSILRITRELHDIQKGSDLSIAVACRDVDVRSVRALIIGPADTPYEFGFFEFNVKFNKDYPTKPPNVTAITTNGGRTRFNPNIYAGGKVCLSILGTWRGERGEMWSSAQGLESILISIQSLMSSNPYENEPGYEMAHSVGDKIAKAAYVAKIRHETLRISIIQRLEGYLGLKGTNQAPVPTVEVYDSEEKEESAAYPVEAPFEPFIDLCKRRFLWYYDSYLNSIEEESLKHADGTPFLEMPFESAGNTMKGTFNYTDLKKRLEAVRKALVKEAEGWQVEGMRAAQNELGIASNLQRQFEQVKEAFRNGDTTIDLELAEKNNPFVWDIILFGRPMSNLDGGIFRIRVRISPRFPDVQPRAEFQTPIFHHRVSKDGVICYNPLRKDDMKSHMEAIIQSIEEEDPTYDPRTLVNLEASKLYWGSPDEKKMYSRKLRRSAQGSSEA